MNLYETLLLRRSGTPVRRFPLEGIVEIGSDPGCDIVVHGTGVPGRALLVRPGGGSAYVYDLAACPALRKSAVMPLAEPIAIGGGYSVVRERGSRLPMRMGVTERMRRTPGAAPRIRLVCRGGSDARAFRVAEEPLSVGVAPSNAITLVDRAVSQYHCRIEPTPEGCAIRDLGSTNGTRVDGVRVRRRVLVAGTIVRVGRTDLRVVDEPVDASEQPLVVASSAMVAVMAEVESLARLPWPVLIRGETGVGKEHVARAIHERGERRAGPFIALNAGGLPPQLVESELFGHERGAFTGASRTHRGAFERAHGGTLFLDEIIELPIELQTRLLRVLETWRVRRLGGESPRRVDVRLVCATHGDLRGAVQAGRFRADLFYRVNRLVLEVPPLRKRLDDVGPLVAHFLSAMPRHVPARRVSADALRRLERHPWPGNVRELRNVLEVAAAELGGECIDLAGIGRALQRSGAYQPEPPSVGSLRETVELYRGNLSAAARALGMPRSTLRDRLKSARGTP